MGGFWIDVYDANDTKTNAHTQAVSSVRITERINQIGECSFTVPAIVATQIGAAMGMRYRLYDETDCYLGVFTHRDMVIDADGQTATITAYDSLITAANRVIGFGNAFTNTEIEDILNSSTNGILLSLGWEAVMEPGFDSTQEVTLEFRGESVLRGLDVLRQFVRGYFRRESDTSVQFGDFSATTPVARLYGPVADFSRSITDYAAITTLKRDRKGSGVVNRVYAFGSGIGETQIDLRYATRDTPYAVGSVVLNGGERAYYIEDSDSRAQYGLIERLLTVTEIRPITNSAADLINAGNALHDMATAYLQRYRAEQDVYTLACVGLGSNVKVGDLVRVDYSGICELESGAAAFLTLTNQRFFVTEITRDYGDSGDPITQLTVSSTGEEIVGTVEVLSNLIEDVSKFKLRVQPSMTYYTKSAPTLPIDPIRYVDFTFYMGSEVLAINEMKVEFRLMPLRTYASTTATAPSTSDTSGSGGGSTPTTSALGTTHSHSININSSPSGSNRLLYIDDGLNLNTGGIGSSVSTATQTTNDGHTHTVTIAAHTHSVTIPAHNHSLTFGITDDTQTPQTVTVSVNGTAVGGIINADTGAVVGSSVSGAGLYLVDILAAITDTDFRNRTHVVRFECGSQRGQLMAQLLSRVTIQPIATG